MSEQQNTKLVEALNFAAARVQLMNNEGDLDANFVLDVLKLTAQGRVDELTEFVFGNRSPEAIQNLIEDADWNGFDGHLTFDERNAEYLRRQEESRLAREAEEARLAAEKAEKIRTEGTHMTFFGIRNADGKFFSGFHRQLNRPTYNKVPFKGIRFETSEQARNMQLEYNVPGEIVQVERYRLVGTGAEYDFIPTGLELAAPETTPESAEGEIGA